MRYAAVRGKRCLQDCIYNENNGMPLTAPSHRRLTTAQAIVFAECWKGVGLRGLRPTARYGKEEASESKRLISEKYKSKRKG